MLDFHSRRRAYRVPIREDQPQRNNVRPTGGCGRQRSRILGFPGMERRSGWSYGRGHGGCRWLARLSMQTGAQMKKYRVLVPESWGQKVMIIEANNVKDAIKKAVERRYRTMGAETTSIT